MFAPDAVLLNTKRFLAQKKAGRFGFDRDDQPVLFWPESKRTCRVEGLELRHQPIGSLAPDFRYVMAKLSWKEEVWDIPLGFLSEADRKEIYACIHMIKTLA